MLFSSPDINCRLVQIDETEKGYKVAEALASIIGWVYKAEGMPEDAFHQRPVVVWFK